MLWIDEEDWLEQRKKGIGGSEASMILGINPWKSKMELWNEKVTQIPKIDATKQLMFKVGRTLEPIIAEEYIKVTGRELEERPLKIHPNYPFILGNIDREIIGTPNGKKPGVLEIKTRGSQTDWHGEEIPIYYQVQLQHYLNLYDYSWGSFAVLDLGRMDLKIIDIERNDELICRIIKEEVAFWELVQKRIPPPPDSTNACNEFLKEKYKLGDSITLDLKENEDANKWIPILRNARDNIKMFEEAEMEAKNHLMSIMKNAEKAVGNGFTISWKSPKDKEIFDLERFKLEQPELAKQYIRLDPQSRRFMVRFPNKKQLKGNGMVLY